jgi:hypothetical protein
MMAGCEPAMLANVIDQGSNCNRSDDDIHG